MSTIETFQDAFNYTKEKVRSGFNLLLESISSEHTQKMALSSMVFGSAMSVMLATSIFIYLIIYFVSMPVVQRTQPVYFDYSRSVPTAFLDLRIQEHVELMKPNQKYTLGLELNLPDSERNLNLGNFMVSLELTGKGGTLQKAHLKYKSPLLRHMTTIYNSISLLTDRSSESQTIFVPLIQNYEEKASRSVQEIRVEIHQPALETYETRIKFETEFQGLAYFMYHWWLSTAIFFITNILLVEVLFASYIWNILMSSFQSDNMFLDDEDDHKEFESSSENENSTIYETSTPPATGSTTTSRVTQNTTESEESGHELDFEDIRDIRGYTASPGFQITTQSSLGTGYAVPVTSYSAQKLKATSPLPHSRPLESENSEVSLVDEVPVLITESDGEDETPINETDSGNTQSESLPIEIESIGTDIDIRGLLESEEEVNL